MGNTFYFAWEMHLMEWLQSSIPSFLVPVLSSLSLLGEPIFAVIVLGFFYWGYDKEFGKRFGLSVIFASLFNPMLKSIFNRRRPYFDNDRLHVFRQVSKEGDLYDVVSQGYSFPSGHSSNAAVLMSSLYLYLKKRFVFILAIVLTFLVGFSRVFVGVHFPTDVLFGWLCGFGCVLVFQYINQKIKHRYRFYWILVLLTLPGFLYCDSHDYFTSFGMLVGYAFAMPFEEKYVKFKQTRSIRKILPRLAGGGILYFGLNELLKLPFSSAFLDASTLASFAIRSVRYAIVIFVVLAIYPMLFKRIPILRSEEKSN